VIKADGLAAGKGVVIAEDLAQAEECVRSFMSEGSLGDAGRLIVLEDYLGGREVSLLAALSVKPGENGGACLPFIAARDHKRRFDGDEGPNTGGMGAVAPVPDFSPAAQDDFRANILEPTLRGVKAEGLDYRGFIFFGLMVRDETCYLLEYNVRLGDPETQAVLPLMDSDFLDLCIAVEQGELSGFPLVWKNACACAPVAVAQGYPGAYRKGDALAINWKGLDETGAKLFAAGVLAEAGRGLVTSGGRVLAVSCLGADKDQAWERAYRALGMVDFEGMSFRRDIGRTGLS
jgi:phosphoribosylamine--glycine ligase